MNESTKEVCLELLYVLNAPTQLREHILSTPNLRLTLIICEFSLNLLVGEIPLSERDKTTLFRHKKQIELLADEDARYAKKLKVLKGLEPELLNIYRDILDRHV